MVPLTIRYNNPGALEYQPWMAKYGASLGENGRYAAFPSPDAGYQVMGKVLDTYQNKHGLNTVAGIVNRWAPASVDNNSTSTYTQKVAQALGVDPNAPLSSAQRPALMQAMASYEAGRAAPMPAIPGNSGNSGIGASAPNVSRETNAAPGSFRAAQEPQQQETPMQPMGFMPQLDPAMMQQQPGQQQGGFGGFLQNMTSNPLFLMGAGVLGGQNVGQGLMGGMQMANQMQQAQMDRAMKERAFQEQLRMHNQTLALQQQTEQRNAQMTPYQIKLLQTQAAEAEGKARLSQQERAMHQRMMDAAAAYQAGQAPAATPQPAMPPQMAPGGGLSAAAGASQPMPAPTAPPAQALQQGVMTQYGMLPLDLAETAAMSAAMSGKPEAAKMIQEKLDTARAGGMSKKYRETADATTAEAVAKAQIALPSVMQKGQEALAQINELKTHDGRPLATGMLSVVPAVPGTRQFDFISAHENLIDKTYVTAIEAFVGLGALSNAEGAAAKSAATDLKRGQSGPAYDRSLRKLQASIEKGMENAQLKAGMAKGQQPAPAATGQPVRVSSPDEAMKLPPGTPVLLPDGTLGRVPG